MAQTEPLVVLESFPAPRPTTNPYIVMLARSQQATEGLEMLTFSWRRALRSRYDVFHCHWPENLLEGRDPLRRLAKQLAFVALLITLRVRRVAVVRTMHNLELPTGLGRRRQALLRLLDRMTTLRIGVNATTAFGPGQVGVTILHGHYRDWFAEFPRQEPVPGRFAFFGLVRRYKGLDLLVAAFRATDDPDLTLTIAGKPSTDEISQTLVSMAAGDPRVDFHFAFLSDAELVETATRSQLVVLPYPEMHNSGGVLASLSVNRPVLVRDNEAARVLAAEVGPGWILTYEDELTGQDLLDALRTVEAGRRSAEPDLSGREWDDAGVAHRDAFSKASSLIRR